MIENNEYIKLPIEELRTHMKRIKRKLVYGELSYDEAKEISKPIVDAINYKLMDLCFELGRKIKTLSFYEIIKYQPWE